jgi:sphinganine-1-phosphate aldolase
VSGDFQGGSVHLRAILEERSRRVSPTVDRAGAGARRPCDDRAMSLSQQGRDVDEVIAELAELRRDDVRWSEGRAFGMVYDGGPSVHDAAEKAARLYLHENALNTMAFPSLGRIQSDVVGWTGDLLHAPDGAAGFVTSGGTESILCAVLAARERARAERSISEPEMVLAESAHAAFHKAAHLFDVRVRKVPVLADWTIDLDAMADAIGPNTVLVVGSAPQYPQGVVDPIPAIAELAASVGANCHVDACMGGFVLPFAEMLGREVPPWDFRVEGVHTISADVHKLGYAPKGASVILHRSRELRRFQTFAFDDWLGGFYASPNLQGSRSGLPLAAAWAVMQHLGVDGYLRLTDDTLKNSDRMRAGIAATDGVRVLGDGTFHLIAMAADPDASSPVDVFALGDALRGRGWFHDRQGPPDSLHSTVSNSNAGVIDEYLADLATCVGEVRGAVSEDRSTNYATLE